MLLLRQASQELGLVGSQLLGETGCRGDTPILGGWYTSCSWCCSMASHPSGASTVLETLGRSVIDQRHPTYPSWSTCLDYSLLYIISKNLFHNIWHYSTAVRVPLWSFFSVSASRSLTRVAVFACLCVLNIVL